METKVWENSYTKEDIETLLGKPLTDGEWNIIADELYNNDKLYELITTEVMKIVYEAIE
jgi:hypothetical protein